MGQPLSTATGNVWSVWIGIINLVFCSGDNAPTLF